jgi:pimeloyl-ACP methyl ester carboxylesterase
VLRAFANGAIFGETYGEDRAWLLALHGWRRDHSDFAAVFARSGEDALSGIAVDLPGFGASPPPAGAWGAESYAAALEPVLEEMAARVVVLGHSFGGNVALALARRRPDRVAGLVLSGVPRLAAAPGRPRVALGFRARRALRRGGLISERAMARAREHYGSPDYQAATGVMREVFVQLLRERSDEDLAALAVPVELVWGELDTAAPIEAARRATSLARDGRLVVLLGVDHFTPAAAPEELRAAALRVHER